MKNLGRLVNIFLIIIVVLLGVKLLSLLGFKNTTIPTKAEVAKLEKEIQKYREEDEKIQERQEELENLSDPQVALDQLKTVGKIISYEGKVGYDDYIHEKTFLGNKKLYIELKYKFGISIDTQHIEIVNIEDTKYGTKVNVRIPKDKLELEYLSLVANESKLDDDVSLFATRFKSEDYQSLLQMAEEKTRERILNTDEIWYKAHENMKMEVVELLIKLKDNGEFKFSIVGFVE